MERETKKLQTPLGKDVELKTYITAEERNQLSSIFLKAFKVGFGKDGKPEIQDSASADVMIEAQKKLLEIAVVSYDGSKENALARILASSPDEYDWIVVEADKIKSGNLT